MKVHFRRGLSVVICTLIMTGCAPWIKTQAKEFTDSSRGFRAVLPDGWMRYNRGFQFLMTKDGIVLNSITVSRKKIKDKLEATKRMFEESMLPMDIADIEIDNLKSYEGIDQVSLVKNEPYSISGQEGFHLTYTFLTKGGLKIQGEHYGFRYKNWVYRIVYEAPVQHYYAKGLPAFDDFLKSFVLSGNSSNEPKS